MLYTSCSNDEKVKFLYIDDNYNKKEVFFENNYFTSKLFYIDQTSDIIEFLDSNYFIYDLDMDLIEKNGKYFEKVYFCKMHIMSYNQLYGLFLNIMTIDYMKEIQIYIKKIKELSNN